MPVAVTFQVLINSHEFHVNKTIHLGSQIHRKMSTLFDALSSQLLLLNFVCSLPEGET